MTPPPSCWKTAAFRSSAAGGSYTVTHSLCLLHGVAQLGDVRRLDDRALRGDGRVREHERGESEDPPRAVERGAQFLKVLGFDADGRAQRRIGEGRERRPGEGLHRVDDGAQLGEVGCLNLRRSRGQGRVGEDHVRREIVVAVARFGTVERSYFV